MIPTSNNSISRQSCALSATYYYKYQETNQNNSEFANVSCRFDTRDLLSGIMDRMVLALSTLVDTRFDGSDDDAIDRLSRRYSVLVFVVFSVIVGSRQLVGERIHCWVPARFTANHETYANSVCWVSSTYYLPFDDVIPAGDVDRRRKLSYYQWIPLLLLAQAAMFAAPSWLVGRAL